eukprot:TRINITY_DN5527_c0_g1_i1.p1 TRINITY_DN5527_c0_g1~~TRINITY_DN5527_c0_g1_i1.p1  ORF type:complete len:153 (+),score=27.57 TRINITY_DN5527_c0_g1_i1:249-707(+)
MGMSLFTFKRKGITLFSSPCFARVFSCMHCALKHKQWYQRRVRGTNKINQTTRTNNSSKMKRMSHYFGSNSSPTLQLINNNNALLNSTPISEGEQLLYFFLNLILNQIMSIVSLDKSSILSFTLISSTFHCLFKTSCKITTGSFSQPSFKNF